MTSVTMEKRMLPLELRLSDKCLLAETVAWSLPRVASIQLCLTCYFGGPVVTEVDEPTFGSPRSVNCRLQRVAEPAWTWISSAIRLEFHVRQPTFQSLLERMMLFDDSCGGKCLRALRG